MSLSKQNQLKWIQNFASLATFQSRILQKIILILKWQKYIMYVPTYFFYSLPQSAWISAANMNCMQFHVLDVIISWCENQLENFSQRLYYINNFLFLLPLSFQLKSTCWVFILILKLRSFYFFASNLHNFVERQWQLLSGSHLSWWEYQHICLLFVFVYLTTWMGVWNTIAPRCLVLGPLEPFLYLYHCPLGLIVCLVYMAKQQKQNKVLDKNYIVRCGNGKMVMKIYYCADRETGRQAYT